MISALKAGRKPSLEVMSNWPRVTKRLMEDWERLELRDGVLYRQWYNQQGRITRYQLVTPSQIRAQVLSVAHEGAISGHFAVKRTIAKVREYFYWPRLMTDVESYCKSCIVCQRRKPNPTRPHHPLQQDGVGEPLQKVTVDILAFERPTEQGNRYLLVVVDTLTKWAEAIPMPDERATTVSRALVEEFVCRLGFPSQLHSDQGHQFESEVFKQMCTLLGIRKTRTTPGHPQSDGQTERMNRALIDLLAKSAAEDPANWDIKVPHVMAAYRSTPHSTTGETPNRLMLGREVATPLQLLAPIVPEVANRPAWVETLHENFEEAYVSVQANIGKAQRQQKQSHDKRIKEMNFEIGQKVLMFNTRPPRGVPYKLNQNRWQGPYEIKKKLSPAVCVVTHVGEKRTFVVSTDRLAKYVERPSELNGMMQLKMKRKCPKILIARAPVPVNMKEA